MENPVIWARRESRDLLATRVREEPSERSDLQECWGNEVHRGSEVFQVQKENQAWWVRTVARGFPDCRAPRVSREKPALQETLVLRDFLVYQGRLAKRDTAA